MGNIVFSAILLIFGAAYYVGSARIPSNMLEDPVGASGYPRLISACIVGLAAVILMQSSYAWFRARTAAGGAPPVRINLGGRLRSLGPAAVLFTTMVLFLTAFEHLGYLVSVTLFILAVILQSGTRFGWVPVVTSACGAMFFHLFFAELLGVRLPDGILPLPF